MKIVGFGSWYRPYSRSGLPNQKEFIMRAFSYGILSLTALAIMLWTSYWAVVWYLDPWPLAAAEVIYTIVAFGALFVLLSAASGWREAWANRPRREHNDVSPDYWRDELL